MIKLNIKYNHSGKITPTVKSIFLILSIFFLSSFFVLKHPTYLSVIDIKHNVEQKSIHISIKLFTNDFEDALKKINNKNIDVLNPKNKAEVDTVIYNYLKKRLLISVNKKTQNLSYIGYEKEDESVWVYLEIKKVIKPISILINTKILYDYLSNEVNIVHYTNAKGQLKSKKVTNPDSFIEF